MHVKLNHFKRARQWTEMLDMSAQVQTFQSSGLHWHHISARGLFLGWIKGHMYYIGIRIN